MNKILIAEDEAPIANLIRTALEGAGYRCAWAPDGADAADKLEAQPFDLALLDIMLPGADGYELLEYSKPLGIPVIFLTARGAVEDRIRGLRLGADDYMVKPFDFRELNARIKVLLKRVSGNVPELPQELVYADLRIDLQRKDVERNNVPIKLSPKEYNLLLYMVENAERVLSRVEIAEKVWNTHFDTGTNFIDVYINYLRKKIDRNFEPKLIHTKAGMGFILTDKL